MCTERAQMIEAESLVNDKPLILLDIDGVLNAYHHDYADDESASWGDYQEKYVVIPDEMADLCGHRHGMGYYITWSDTLMGRLLNVTKSGKVDVVWLTSWNQFANHLANICFWPDIPSPIGTFLNTDSHGFNPRYTTQKYIQARDVLVARHEANVTAPVVNVDDEGIHVKSHAERMVELARKYPGEYDLTSWQAVIDAPYTAIAPNPVFGITPQQMEKIEGIVGLGKTA